eukprot:scaffold33626_cov67-Phaeocystis_antarctica.AAC.4
MRPVHHDHVEGRGRSLGRLHPNDAAVLQRAGPRHGFERGTHARALRRCLVQDEEPLQQRLALLWFDTSAQPASHQVGKCRVPCDEEDVRRRVQIPQQFEHLEQGDERLSGASGCHDQLTLIRREVLEGHDVLLVVLHVPSSVELDCHCST